MKIIQAEHEHLSEAMHVISACAQAMREAGIDQWDEVYPNEAVLAQDIRTGSLYIAQQQERCLGAVSLNEQQEEAYRTLSWHGKAPVLVVRCLCIDPAFQRQGIASRLMDFAEGQARERGYASIRLDAYTGNAAALRLYRRRGYRLVGQVYFPRRKLPFDCFEKVVEEEGAA